MTFWPLTNSDFPTNQTFYQFHDLDTDFDLHRITSGFHRAFATGVACQQGTLTIPDTWFRPLFGACIYSDCWDQFSRLYTELMTIPSLTFTELIEVSMEHLRRVWHASRERLPFRTPGSVPHFGTCQCSNCWDQIPRTCHVFIRLFTSNTPWYFLDFASYRNDLL